MGVSKTTCRTGEEGVKGCFSISSLRGAPLSLDFPVGARSLASGARPWEDVAAMPNAPLKRSNDRMIAGVCGGLAEWLGWPADRVRVAYVIVSILSAAFPGIIIYLLLWLLMPDADGA
jgi:phage shock protein C